MPQSKFLPPLRFEMCRAMCKIKNQRTNGPVNAHLSLLHIPINMFDVMVFNPNAGADEALGPFSFFRLINILSMDASRKVSLKSIYWFQRRYLKGFYHIWAWWPSWSCDLDY